MPNHFIRTQVGNANLKKVHAGVGLLMSALDDIPPGEKVAALCVGFLAICNREGLDPHEAVSMTRRMIADALKHPLLTDFQAFNKYIKEEPI